MAVKFFFQPVTQNVGLSIAKMALKKYFGGSVKSDAIAFAKEYFKGNLTLPVNPHRSMPRSNITFGDWMVV